MKKELRTLVTGVASGIGRSVASSLRDRGDIVFGVDYQSGDGWLKADLSMADERERVMQTALEELGAIDVLVVEENVSREYSATFREHDIRIYTV